MDSKEYIDEIRSIISQSTRKIININFNLNAYQEAEIRNIIVEVVNRTLDAVTERMKSLREETK